MSVRSMSPQSHENQNKVMCHLTADNFPDNTTKGTIATMQRVQFLSLLKARIAKGTIAHFWAQTLDLGGAKMS